MVRPNISVGFDKDIQAMTLEKLGYQKIHSAIFGREVYIVKDMDVSVPDTTLLRFDLDEVKYLKKLQAAGKLDDEQLRVLTMAKEEFGGSIIDVTKKYGSKAQRKQSRFTQRKRATNLSPARKESVYEQPTTWNLKSKGRTTV